MRLTADELLRRIESGEGARLEFKRGLPSPEKVARTLAAFANTKGGLLLVGVGDRGEVLGCHDPEAASAALREIAAFRVEPAARVEVNIVECRGAAVVACQVPASRTRPHAAVLDGGARDVCVRLGSSTRTAGGATLAALRSAPSAAGGLGALERDALAWLARGRGTDSTRGATPDAFAAARNLGRSRARQVFVALERAGLVIGHGRGAAREYALPGSE